LMLGAAIALPGANAANEEAKGLEQLVTEITREKQLVDDLHKRLESASGFIEQALRSRLIKARVALLETNLKYATAVADAEDAGNKNDEHHKQAIETLDS